MPDIAKSNQEQVRSGRRGQTLIADNDDDLPGEICRIIDALARAAAKRDHHGAAKGSSHHD